MTSPPQQSPTNKTLFFRTKVLSKVGLAIRRLKELVVLSKPDFRCKELLYLEDVED